VLSREASAWTQTFPDAVAWGPRVCPAFFVEDGVAVIDGELDPAFGGGDPIDPRGRVLLLVERDAARLLALGCVRAAVRDATRTTRFVVGPVAVARRIAPGLLDVFAGELLRLLRLLPGTPAAIEYAFASRALAFQATGFAAVPGHPGWLSRAAESTSSEADDAAHDELVDAARDAAAFAAWAQRVQRASAGRAR
jgi:hypothetical protein